MRALDERNEWRAEIVEFVGKVTVAVERVHETLGS